jgi:hypothetical protein
MALTLEVSTSRILGLSEFLAYVREEVDPSDPDSGIRAAPMLLALAQNRTFLAEEIHRQLQEWRSYQAGNDFISETFVLGRGPGFLVRANFWTPQPESEAAREIHSRVNSVYRIVHNHSFSFLTVGYWGPGYGTDVYEVDAAACQAEVGERVDLRYLETTTLPVGKVMYYRRERDVHLQRFPPELSVSLNLVLSPPDTSLCNQLYFEAETGNVIGRGSSGAAGWRFLCRMSGALGDTDTGPLLDAISTEHPSRRVRAAALAALAERAITPPKR